MWLGREILDERFRLVGEYRLDRSDAARAERSTQHRRELKHAALVGLEEIDAREERGLHRVRQRRQRPIDGRDIRQR